MLVGYHWYETKGIFSQGFVWRNIRLFCHFHDSCYICQRIKTKCIMAKPIKETPVLTGDDATRFAEAAHEVVPASQKEKDDAKKAYSFFASIANFAL